MTELPRHERDLEWYIEDTYISGADGGYDFVQDSIQDTPQIFSDDESHGG